jgi:proline iminopeptidase
MNLPVTQGHVLHYAEFGNPAGIPLLFVHGGPGSGCNPAHASLLYPQGFRIIQFDQRGCGQSTPGGRLLGNRTAALVRDMEALRQHLGIAQWVIYGGSWGATLALEYAKHYPQQALGLLLRGAFLARQEDWEWFSLPHGVAQQFPEAYQALLHGVNDHNLTVLPSSLEYK